jgi:hypothetical protein
MFRGELPRVYELRDQIKDQDDPNACFQDFDNSLRDRPAKKKEFDALERVVQKLEADSWGCLSKKASKYLAVKHDKRGWHQLFDILNEARAYRYLKRIGCSDIGFIPEAKKPTPDLWATLGGQEISCEVKTINISDNEALDRIDLNVKVIKGTLEQGFLDKLDKTIEAAQKQLGLWRTEASHIIYIVPMFDEALGEYKQNYFQEIDCHLQSRTSETKLVFCNLKTTFHKDIQMEHAKVDNE